MKKFISALLAMTLSVSLASECITFRFLSPLSFDLSETVAFDFVTFAANKEEVWGSAEVYIAHKGWNEVVEAWKLQNEQSSLVLTEIALIDVYFRSALFDCHGVYIHGERYSPLWYQQPFYRMMLSEGCACFDELTNYLFSPQ